MSPADWTPERIEEARGRCERATPGPWVHSPPGVDAPHVSTKIGSDGERVNWLASPRSAPSNRWHDAAFIAHAREDLPAALAWGEQQAREIEALRANLQSVLGSACRRAEELAAERDSKAAEIERLAAELAARAPADASLEARAQAAFNAWYNSPGDPWLAVVRAVDASRPAATARAFPRVTLGTVAPGSLVEIASGDIGVVTNGATNHGQRPMLWIVTGHVGTMPAAATVSLRATPAELDVLTSADASRPGLSEEEAREMAGPLCRDIYNRIGLATGNRIGAPEWMRDSIAAALLRASRGEAGPNDQAVCMAAAAKAGWTFDPATGRWSGPAAEPFEKIEQLPPTPGRFDVPVVQAPPAGSWQAPRCDKGHVARPGAPCPICRRASLEAALHDPETAEGAAAILADMPPPDPRATLHAGDPESGVDGSGVLVPHPANVLASKRGDK